MPKTFVTLGINGFGGFAEFYRKDVPAVFADVNDATLQQQLKIALEGAAAAMDGLADWLKHEEIGRASCRESVCQHGVDLGGRRLIKKKKNIKNQYRIRQRR